MKIKACILFSAHAQTYSDKMPKPCLGRSFRPLESLLSGRFAPDEPHLCGIVQMIQVCISDSLVVLKSGPHGRFSPSNEGLSVDCCLVGLLLNL